MLQTPYIFKERINIKQKTPNFSVQGSYHVNNMFNYNRKSPEPFGLRYNELCSDKFFITVQSKGLFIYPQNLFLIKIILN